MEVHLTTSELAALKRIAGHEGYVPTKWVVAMIRTKLTGQPQVGQSELERLTRSNQQLLALGRNLNQIAKVLNTTPQNRTAFRVEVITELSRVIQAHTKKVSDVLRGTVERWHLQ
jgi:NADP-dependent 3-hydroxy acid dehydrogenase YdfG